MACTIGRSSEEEVMGRLLLWLTKKRFFDDTELQKIMSKNILDEKKLEIYKILMEKEQNTVANKILNTLRMMTATIAPRRNKNGNHPLLNAVITDCIFGFLPTNDILNCRLVCLPWSISSKNILRQRVIIDFKTSGPSKFLNVFDNPFASDVPFQNFMFSNNADGWDVSEIHNFFKQWGHNVKYLTFDMNFLFAYFKGNCLPVFDITSWVSMATNLIYLKVYMPRTEKKATTKIAIQLSKLTFIKHLTFWGKGCIVVIDNVNDKISPLTIKINSVSFQRDGRTLRYFLLNDVIDFSKSTRIFLSDHDDGETKFGIDMANEFQIKHNFNLIHIMNRIKNWSEAKGSAHFLHLDNAPIKERNQLKIKQMELRNSDVDISVLPMTIEKLEFTESIKFVHSTKSKCRLPMLKYLRLHDPKDYYLMPMIAYYSNLVELELGGSCINDEPDTLNIHWIPKSVKRLKINSMQVEISHRNEINDGAAQEMQDEGYVLNIDTLILEDYLHCLDTNVYQIISKIQPSVLVVTCMDSSKLINTTSICDFVCTNKHLEKIIIGSPYDLHKKTPFYNSVLSHLVKDKSNYYLFENHHKITCYEFNGKDLKEYVGKRISYKKFCDYRGMDRLDSNVTGDDFKWNEIN